MGDEWFYLRGGEPVGPVNASELRVLARKGLLDRGDLIWKDGLVDWVAAGRLKGLFGGPPPAPKVTAPTVRSESKLDVAPGVDRIANVRMLDQLRRDADDQRAFFGELLRISIRHNPVNIQTHEFVGHLNRITDQTPRSEVADLVGQALGAIDLVGAIKELDETDTGIIRLAGGLVRSRAENLAKTWPDSWEPVKHPWIQSPNAAANSAEEAVRRALQMQRSDLIEIQQQVRQLCEFFPRYRAVITRSGFWAALSGFASGFLGGELGAAGYAVWEDWRNKSDWEFATLFGTAVDSFTAASFAFTRKTEESVVAAWEPLLAEGMACVEAIVTALTSHADTANLSKIYAAIRDTEKISDEHDRQVFEVVLGNLKEKGLSPSSEQNLRTMHGL